ncbi:hypothetical protein WBQ88_15735 [Sphingopyxis sp. CCNWLW253]|uniref:DUF7002 family protein n=1 Tax=unclassified Sphingopyxis TaxID=2614943 RepID=UPI003012F37B
MTDEELGELLKNCPALFHMAMRDSWPLIQKHGLLPTNRLLELFDVDHETRAELTTKRRPASFPIAHPEVGSATIRDQIPLYDHHLAKCLQGGLSPIDWHAKLNERVFFWLTEKRLQKLLCAGAYRKQQHVVLKINTAMLVNDHRERIELAPMNTGCTMPFAHPRGPETFLPIDQYPYSNWRKKGRSRHEAVVELTVIGGVPNIADYVEEVTIRKCGEDPVPVQT